VLLCVQCHHQVLLVTEHELQQLLWQLTHAPLHLPILHLLLCLHCFCRQVLLMTEEQRTRAAAVVVAQSCCHMLCTFDHADLAAVRAMQVLLMTEDEFQQLQQAEQEQQQQQGLDLGRDLLQGEFGELVATVLLQVGNRRDASKVAATILLHCLVWIATWSLA
jgi:hypothetical protein